MIHKKHLLILHYSKKYMICKELSKTLILGIYGHPNDKFVTFAGLMSTNQLIHVYITHATSYKLDHE